MRTTPAALLAATLCAACGPRPDPLLIVTSGHVEATDVRMATKVPGRLQSLAVKEGDAVAAGAELARIDTTDQGLTLDQLRAERDQARAELRLRLAGARKEDIAELAAQAESVQADLDAAERDLARMQGLLDRGSGTTKARDDARTRRDMLHARAAAAAQSLARARAGFRDEEKDGARARVAATEARIAQLEQQVEDATLRSPLDGLVTEKLAEPGELLQAGSPICVITDLKDAWLNVYVGEPDLGRIRLGQQAEVRTDDGQSRAGKITFISSKAEFTPKNVQTRDERVKLVYKVKVALPNQDGLFKPGMPAEARIQAQGAAK
jgi:HlyD family secretion protein